MIEVINVDVDSTPMTGVVVFDGDDTKALRSGDVVRPMLYGRGFLENASNTLFFTVSFSVGLYVECSVGSIVSPEQVEEPLCDVHF